MDSYYQPLRLRTDSFDNPLGLTVTRPLLQWELPTPMEGESVQPTAFRIRVGENPEALQAGHCSHWDSGWIASNFNEVVYAGQTARSREHLWWQVCVQTNDGNTSPWSTAAFWESGLLELKDWQAQWLTTALIGGKRTGVQAPYLRREFSLPGRPVKARLYITAQGLYECEINGHRVGEDVFTPGWTDYKKRLAVQTYDVSALLRKGGNAMGAVLGDGWYCGFVNHGDRQHYGLTPALLAQLEVELEDGRIEFINSAEDWKYSAGPILENDLLMGESYDARLEHEGWSLPDFDDANWCPVQIAPAPAAVLMSSAAPNVRRQEMFPVSAPIHTRKGVWQRRIYDIGQNIAGRVRIKVRGSRGSYFRILHGEMLDADGNVYVENLRSARSTDHYVCRSGDIEIWEPRFTFHGFRYVEIASSDVNAEVIKITGIALYTNMQETGKFECSDPALNKLFTNIHWGMKGNFLEVPADCPQRDERQGWTGDAQVFVTTACFLRDVKGFFEKWALDVADAQLPNGAITAWAPRAHTPHTVNNDSGPAWSDAVVICPWEIYQNYADRRILEQNYPTMQRFLDFLKKHRCKDNIRSHPDVDHWGGHGDWLALDGSTNQEGNTPKDLIGTAFLAYDLELMGKIATTLNLPEDAAAYANWRTEVVQAFRDRFVTKEGLLTGGTQTSYVLALRFGLLPKSVQPLAAAELVRDIKRRNWHLSTGFIGTPHLCRVLEDHGYLDVAYRLLLQDSFPSWLFPVKNGATTIWERWDGWTPEKGFQDAAMNSFNHYAYGAVGAWMVRTLGGIDIDEDKPGGSHIIFRPRPTSTISRAKTQWHSVRGQVSIEWEARADGLHLLLQVPAYSSATLDLGSRYLCQTKELSPGVHRIFASHRESGSRMDPLSMDALTNA